MTNSEHIRKAIWNPNLFGERENYERKNHRRDPKKEYQLEPAQCQNRTDLQGFECHDHYLNGVTYRVWSVFEGQTNAVKSLSDLMLRKLESGEEVGEVEDGFEEMIRRKFREAEEYCEENHLLTPEFTEQFKRLTATC